MTDRARKVMSLANQEAQRLNHEHIGTEHILLGIVKEGTSGGTGNIGTAVKVLTSLEIDLRKVRIEVQKLVKAGPEMVTMGRLPQTPRAKKVIEWAIEEARNFNHNYVGTEHLLIGLIREYDGVAATVLRNLGLEIGKVRQDVLAILGESGAGAVKMGSGMRHVRSSGCDTDPLGIHDEDMKDYSEVPTDPDQVEASAPPSVTMTVPKTANISNPEEKAWEYLREAREILDNPTASPFGVRDAIAGASVFAQMALAAATLAVALAKKEPPEIKIR